MNQFVNFKERGVTLPPGCKDLIDLLRPSAKQAVERAERLAVTRDETFTGVLPDIGKYIKMAFESRAAVFTLAITPAARCLELEIVRFEGEEPFASLTFPKAAEDERLVQSFLTSKGLRVSVKDSMLPAGFSANLPVQMIYYVCPLPADAPGLSALVTDFFLQCGRLGNDACFRFHIEELSE